MAGLYGDSVASTVTQSRKTVTTGAWTALHAGSTPQTGRRHVRFQAKSSPGGFLAVAYAQKNSDGTFTTPTITVKGATQYPGNSMNVEPLSDKVAIYGRMVKKKGVTANSMDVVVTEYS